MQGNDIVEGKKQFLRSFQFKYLFSVYSVSDARNQGYYKF